MAEMENNGYSCPARPEPLPNEAEIEKYVLDMLDKYGRIASEDGVRNIIRGYRSKHNL